MYDLIIKNGTVIDPANGVHGQADVVIDNGLVITFDTGKLPEARYILDASGCYVTPGLIDYHLHLAPLAEIGVYGETACFPSGVTTAVDCGSSGAGTYEGHRHAILSSPLTIKSFLHVCSAGLATGQYHENPDPKFWDRPKITRLFRKYPDELIGLKVRQGAEIVGHLGLEPLTEAVKLAESLGVPVMVHCSNPPSALSDMLALLRHGDILTHAFQDKGYSLLDEGGKIIQAAHHARERGVIFDVANATIHFSFAVAKQAIAEGFLPDTISTDLTTRSLYKRPAVFNLAFVLSKFLNLGMTMDQIIASTTAIPARLIGLEGRAGCLSPGSAGDVAVFKEIEHYTEFGDRTGVIIGGTRLLKPMLTVKAGEMVYRDMGF
ncbi:MAG: amidohydrolase family protein [Spirochaetota bacterium]